MSSVLILCICYYLSSTIYNLSSRKFLQKFLPVKAEQISRLQQTLTVESPAEPYQPTALTVKAVVDSMGIYLTFKELHSEEQQVRTVETVVEKEVNVLRWWQTALMWMGGVALILLVAIVTARLLHH